MIQSIKMNVVVGEGNDKELSFDYEEDDNMVFVYLDNKHICTMDFEGNFKDVVNKIVAKW